MAEYIEREAVIDLITCRYENPEICTQEINSIPAADVAPLVHGRWVSVAGKRDRICSRCLHNEPYKNADDDAEVFEFCPYCGAKMDGGDSDDFPEAVTRCKDCKHFNHKRMECENEAISTDHEGGAQYSLNFGPDDFCSYGEPKEGGNG